MSQNKFPAGWNEEKVGRVLTYYEIQPEDDALLEDEAAIAPSGRVANRKRTPKSRATLSRIFISYSSKDKAFAELVAAELRRANLDPWIDRDNVLAGDDVLERLGEGLKTMDLLLFVVSRDALRSEWVDRELKFATKRAIKDREIRILPFIIDDTPDDALPWYVSPLYARRVTPDRAGARDICQYASEALKKRIAPSSSRLQVGRTLKGDTRLDALIKPVKLGDWNAAELAALEIVKATDASGRNELFEVLFDYQDFADDDPRLWAALHTIECCVALAPWLIRHRMISRMASHWNFSVRSSAASICMDLAHSAPDRVPFDVLVKLSSYDEDWYVETPANSALKAMARSFPAVLRLFFQRLHSSSAEEREHTVYAICDIASKEPEILSVAELEEAALHLRSIGDTDAYSRLTEALSKAKAARHMPRYRYGF